MDIDGFCRAWGHEDSTNNFAAACYNTNTLLELARALRAPADSISLRDWGITEAEFFDGVRAALVEKGRDLDEL